MSSLRQLARDLALEAEHDYVGVSQVVDAVREAAPDADASARRDAALAVIALLLQRGLAIGQFRTVSAASAPDYLFEPWPEPRAELLGRLRAAWDALGRDPATGEIAWIVARVEPDLGSIAD